MLQQLQSEARQWNLYITEISFQTEILQISFKKEYKPFSHQLLPFSFSLQQQQQKRHLIILLKTQKKDKPVYRFCALVNAFLIVS